MYRYHLQRCMGISIVDLSKIMTSQNDQKKIIENPSLNSLNCPTASNCIIWDHSHGAPVPGLSLRLLGVLADHTAAAPPRIMVQLQGQGGSTGTQGGLVPLSHFQEGAVLKNVRLQRVSRCFKMFQDVSMTGLGLILFQFGG